MKLLIAVLALVALAGCGETRRIMQQPEARKANIPISPITPRYSQWSAIGQYVAVGDSFCTGSTGARVLEVTPERVTYRVTVWEARP